MSNNNDNKDNVIRIPSLAERDRLRKKKDQQHKNNNPKEPFINLPRLTKKILITMISIHIIMEIIKHTLDPEIFQTIYHYLSFTPASFTGNSDFLITTIITPLTYMLIHSGWVHLAINTVMGAIFASITEKWAGGTRMILIFMAGGIIGAIAHLIVEPSSLAPLVGASGGISALFGSSALMMYRTGMLGQGGTGIRHPLVMFIGIWIIISLLFGLMDDSIAWASHLGGLLGGFAFAKYVLKL